MQSRSPMYYSYIKWWSIIRQSKKESVFRTLNFGIKKMMFCFQSALCPFQNAERIPRLSPFIGRRSRIKQQNSILPFKQGLMGMAEKDRVQWLGCKRSKRLVFCGPPTFRQKAMSEADSYGSPAYRDHLMVSKSADYLRRIVIACHPFNRSQQSKLVQYIHGSPVSQMNDHIHPAKSFQKCRRQGLCFARHMRIRHDSDPHPPYLSGEAAIRI